MARWKCADCSGPSQEWSLTLRVIQAPTGASLEAHVADALAAVANEGGVSRFLIIDY